MGRMPRATYLWPGLPQLWDGGVWSGLILAVGFTALLNVLLLASYVWVELLSPTHLTLGWLAAGVVWLTAAVLSAWNERSAPAKVRAVSAETLFREALSEYLQGNWFEAERVLGRLLQRFPRDVEARLMLATLLRHTRRYDESLEQLSRVSLLRDAEKWSREIAAEREWVLEEQAAQHELQANETAAANQGEAEKAQAEAEEALAARDGALAQHEVETSVEGDPTRSAA